MSRSAVSVILLGLALGGAWLQIGAAAGDSNTIEKLLARNPRGRAIVEQLARDGREDAMGLLCEAGIRDASRGPGTWEPLRWCSRAAQIGHPAALRELGMELLLEPDRAVAREGLALLALAELAGDAGAELEMPLLPDFFDVSTRDIGRARAEARRRVESGDFHDTRVLGFQFELTARERQALGSRRLRFQQQTAPLGAAPDRLERQLEARRGVALRAPLVTDDEIREHRSRLEAKDALQALLAAELKRASREPELSEWERQALADRQRRRRIGAVLHTERISESEKRELEEALRATLARVNDHRAAEAPLTIDDLGLPWRSERVAGAGPGAGDERDAVGP